MRSVNIAELKNRLSTYVGYAKKGEEIVIRDRKLPVAKIVPFDGGDASDETLLLVAEGKMTLPKRPWSPKVADEIVNMPIPTPRGKTGTELLLEEREEGR
jgi:antitoxin (DNA-binding transcriptional repressor) of toxin-antitoxin stability system